MRESVRPGANQGGYALTMSPDAVAIPAAVTPTPKPLPTIEAENLTKDPDWDALRQRFPVFANKTYINSCSYGALSTDVMDAYQHYMDDRLTRGTDWDHWVGKNEQVRTSVAAVFRSEKTIHDFWNSYRLSETAT